MSINSWIGPNTGLRSWNDPSHWSAGVPLSTDAVAITESGTYGVAITATEPAVLIGSLRVGSGSAFVRLADSGSLTMAGNATFVGSSLDVRQSGIGVVDGRLSLDSSSTVHVEGVLRVHRMAGQAGAEVYVDGGRLTVATAADSSAYKLSKGGFVDIQSTAPASDSFGFLDGAGDRFEYDGAGFQLSSSVTGFRPGDTIDLTNLAYTGGYSYAYSGHSLTLTNTTDPALAFTFANINRAGKLTITGDGTGGTLISVACFAAGTGLRTEMGDVAVQDLRVGDLVATHDGSYHAVTWIGSRRVDIAAHPHPELVAPVCVRRDAIAPGLPARDLRLSPDHALLLDGVLIPVRLLVNDATIAREPATRSVRYYHVELERHAVLLAEGLPAESFLDTGNRANFDAPGAVTRLHPVWGGAATQAEIYAERGCAPWATDPARVRPVWGRLRDRARALGWQLPDGAHDRARLSVVADGRALRPMAGTQGRLVFALPRDTRAVRLISESSAPADVTPYLDDRRRLGVSVARLMLTRGDEAIEVALDDPGLGHGWHDLERSGNDVWRWTSGEATLRHPALADAALLTIELNGAAAIAPATIRQAA